MPDRLTQIADWRADLLMILSWAGIGLAILFVVTAALCVVQARWMARTTPRRGK